MAAKVDPNIAGSVLYEAYQTGLSTSALRILPINDPPIPSSPLGELRFNEWIDDMAIVGDTVFLVTRKGDLYIVDASDPTNPQQVGSWTNPVRDQTYRARILVSGNFAYLSLYSEGLVVLDLSSLSVVASMKGVYVNEVAVSGNLIYACWRPSRLVCFAQLGAATGSAASHLLCCSQRCPHEFGHFENQRRKLPVQRTGLVGAVKPKD
jgi:hypothetical protein